MSEEPPSDRTQVIGPPAAEPAASRLHQNALPVGTMLGEFEIIDLVGEGGFGIVYLAQDHSLHRKVALKEYMPALLASRGKDASVAVRSERQRETFDIGLRSFVNEARMLAQFDHPALIKVYRFWEAHGTAYMVMPFLSGLTLQDALKQRAGAPDETWIRALLSPLMDALAVLHGDKVYHRDIAPDNIMLLADDRPMLLDFGAARRVISDMTHALTVILKPGYAPIEQYADMPGMKQGPWTDVYALAAVVYFMILKRKPPPAVSRLMEDSYEPLMQSEAAGRYSAALLQGIDRCLRVRAEERPQSMAAMREAIGPGTMPTVLLPATLAAVPVVTAPVASAVVAPTPAPVARIASLPAAIDAALAAADPRLSITLEAPAGAAVGNDLTLSVRSKSAGLLYLFVWDQGADRVYRLTPEVKEGGNAVKADGSVTLRYRDAVKHAANAPLGRWRVVAMLSEKPRDFATAAFVRDADSLVVERGALEARLAAEGLASLIGTPQCAASEPCPDRFAIGVTDVAQEAAVAPPAAKRAPAPRTETQNPPGRKAPDSEREYMKKLNKDLDNLLGK